MLGSNYDTTVRRTKYPVRVRELPAPAARPPGYCRYWQAEADLQRGAEGGGSEAERRSGGGEGAGGEAVPGGRERALAGRRRAGEDAQTPSGQSGGG